MRLLLIALYKYPYLLTYLWVSHLTRRWRFTLKWHWQSWLVIFISGPCSSFRALCLMMLHRASLGRHWIAAGLLQLCVLWHVTLITFKRYRECRMLRHELFAKLHNANITQPSFLSISIGYLCMAELTTRLLSFVIKSSNCNNLRTLLVFSRHTDSRVRSSTSDLLSTQSLSTNIATRRFSPFGKVFQHLCALMIVSLVLDRSRLTCSQNIFIRFAVCAPDSFPCPSRSRIINSLLTQQCEKYSASKKKSPEVMWHFLLFSTNRWEFLISFLHTYYTFLSTLDYKFSFIYVQLWWSYLILSTTT